MTRIQKTDALARAAATDAGNRAMRAGGRTAWSTEDYDAAAQEYARLAPAPPGAAFIKGIAQMTQDGERVDGDDAVYLWEQNPDDAVETVRDLIQLARELVKQ